MNNDALAQELDRVLAHEVIVGSDQGGSVALKRTIKLGFLLFCSCM
jgi:hypothetical protein